jgi:hypothetical protein
VTAGEQHAWELLLGLKPEDVCQRARASFNPSSDAYALKVFLCDISISLKDRQISDQSSTSHFLMDELGGYSRLSILSYLIGAKDMPLSGRLMDPATLPGGQIFSGGSHVLPLDKIAHMYGSNPRSFLDRGTELGGEQLDFADASLRLHPFPRVPASILLWKDDEEFTARASLLFDATCRSHLPVDVIWSTAMMSLLIML